MYCVLRAKEYFWKNCIPPCPQPLECMLKIQCWKYGQIFFQKLYSPLLTTPWVHVENTSKYFWKFVFPPAHNSLSACWKYGQIFFVLTTSPSTEFQQRLIWSQPKTMFLPLIKIIIKYIPMRLSRIAFCFLFIFIYMCK